MEVIRMKTGKVKWFNNAKGYGFILADDSNEDLFAHYSTIQMDGYRTLKAGQTVQFETKPGWKGCHVVNIRLLDSAPKLGASRSPDQAHAGSKQKTKKPGKYSPAGLFPRC